ncbi:hypothetical protein KUTeg_024618 [Tegillarca granosa]|uniref:Uncharacterized protein n=1 Tax=Tegillarca granosa TaxID=220873 RepID=A0ABQ9DYL0_TEGGR|nr:hypothetical protein KUTeg_024618 [Tegillarca granosa]
MAHLGYGFERWQRERARDEAVTPNVLDDYFNELKEILEKYKLMNSAPSIWNVDDHNPLDHNPPKILASKGSKHFKGEKLTQEMKSNGLPGSEYRTSETGWSISLLF